MKFIRQLLGIGTQTPGPPCVVVAIGLLSAAVFVATGVGYFVL